MTKKLVKTLLVAICIALIAPNTAFASQSPQENAKKLIVQTAQKMGVDPHMALSIAKIESNFNASAKSPRGAIGLFQLTPSTAKKLGYNPYYLNENIKAGLTYYKMMYKMFGSTELALAAYNAGPGNVKKYGGTIPPYKETRRFVNVIMQDYKTLQSNPDPVITKYSKKTVIEKEAEIIAGQTEVELPDLKEIPEPRQNETTMEIL